MNGSAAPHKMRIKHHSFYPVSLVMLSSPPSVTFASLYLRALAFVCPRGSWLAESKQFCLVPPGKKKEKKLSNVTEMECGGTKCTG